jgi:ribosomal protein L37AE/L43A
MIATVEEKRRVNLGLQCPECSGVQVSCRSAITLLTGTWLCEDCGCQWDRNYYPEQSIERELEKLPTKMTRI